ncbi:hypothetical protein ASE80_03265, partial [Pseudomonas sp. Leaf15]
LHADTTDQTKCHAARRYRMALTDGRLRQLLPQLICILMQALVQLWEPGLPAIAIVPTPQIPSRP